jgi:hypothetical protein
MLRDCSIWIGFDPREADAFAVCRHSLERRMAGQSCPIRGLVLSDLIRTGLHTRPMTSKINAEGRVEMVDVLSIREDYDGRISTQHANARFLVPFIADTGWALFMDGDMLVRADIARMFEQLDPKYALYVVKHQYEPTAKTKMDGQVQTNYSRKNQSSFMVFNCEHKANARLTLEMVNTLPGRDLHRFCWLEDDEIGELDAGWNYLVGHTDRSIDAKCVHFTSGIPSMPGFEDVQFADEWRSELTMWAA